MSRLAKKLGLAAGATLLALCVAEGALRGWSALRGEPHDAEAMASEWRQLLDPAGRFIPTAQAEPARPAAMPHLRDPILHPYTGSEAAHDTGGVLAAFRAGFEPAEYVIVVVGGSVAASWAQAGSAPFLQHLRADPRFAGRRLRLLNYAHASFKQPQQLMRVGYLFSLGYRPDAVLNLDGFNEVALSLQNLSVGTHPVYPPPPVWDALVSERNALDPAHLAHVGRLWWLRQELDARARRALGLRLQHSALLGELVGRDLRRLDRNRSALTEQGPERAAQPQAQRGGAQVDRQRRGPDFDPDPAAVLAAGARNWFESSLSLHALCAARGVFYLHVLQPTLHDAHAKPFSDQERGLGPIPGGWERGAREGYPLLRAFLPELEAQGVRVFDASRLFAAQRETLYEDHCHLNGLGNSLLGRTLGEAYAQALPADGVRPLR